MPGNRYRRLVTALVAVALVILSAVPTTAQQRPSFDIEPAAVVSQESLATRRDESSPLSSPASSGDSAAPSAPGKLVSVVVKLDVDALASYAGDLPGLPATSPLVTGAPALDVAAPDSQRYLAYVARQLSSFESSAQKSVSRLTITHRYDVVLGGVAAIVPADEIDSLARLPGVRAVLPDTLQQLRTEVSPQFIGASAAWEQLGGQASAGEGVIVGVIDSGIWPEHPSVADPDPLGKPFPAPPPAPDGDRACEFSGGENPGEPFSCNNKLIGAQRFMATYEAIIGLQPGEFTSARDDNGHGTHTATTAAGNRGVEASIFGVDRGTVSGVAPRAHLMVYKVCGLAGCFLSDSAAAVQEAIRDGVDVINFSIGGGTNPYADPVSLAFLDAYNAGVFVAAAAGNSGPAPDTVEHREPWVTTVAASTTDRQFVSDLTLVSGDGASLTLQGASVTPAITTPTPVVFATEIGGDELCTVDFPENAAAGKIVICQRGVSGRVAKGEKVFNAGGVGMILYNSPPLPQGVNTDNHFVPTVHLESDAAAELLAFMEAHTGVLASFTPGAPRAGQGDVIASFSSRGGPGQTLGVNKPDVAAPGSQILAGHTPQHADVAGGPQGELFQAVAGTSMASPHVAGAAALLRDLYPDWTPGQIKSALMTTAQADELFLEDGRTPFTPFDAGSGRIDLRQALDPGITFSEDAARFLELADRLWDANLPSLYVPVMPGEVTVQRVAQNVTGSALDYRLRVIYPAGQPRDFQIRVPGRLTVPPGGTGQLTIAIDGRDVPLGEARHATLIFVERGGGLVRFPISFVRAQPAIEITKECAPASIALDQVTRCAITMVNTSFGEADVSLVDQLPRQLRLLPETVSVGQPFGNGVGFNGVLSGGMPPLVTVAAGSQNGYLSLSDLGAPPNVPLGDETLVNFATNRPFIYAGETYNTIGMTSNGYVVVGGGTAQDLSYINFDFPNPAPPNNVLAPFWTDLDGSKGGQYYAYTLCDIDCDDPGSLQWMVLEWRNAPNYSDAAQVNTFQIWIGLNGVEDITFAYGPELTAGNEGFLTVGAENALGSSGANFYSFDGSGPAVGTPPVANGPDVRVTGTPAEPAIPVTVSFQARGVLPGTYVNYAELTSPAFFGTGVARFQGEVRP